MRRLVLKMSVSIDGFVTASDPRSDWMFRAATPDSAAWVLDTLAGADLHVWGRRTFEFGAGFWPTAAGPMAGPTNATPKLVVTRQPDYDPAAAVHGPGSAATESWAAARVLSGDLLDGFTRLKQEEGGTILAQGGAELAHDLIEARLVDEYRFVVLPFALGGGARIFDRVGERDLELVDLQRFTGGVLATTYRPR